MSNNCPVCEKSGLENYTKTHVICPQCNSDLKPYLLINNNLKSNKNKVFLFFVFLLGILLLVSIIIFLNIYNESKKQNESSLTIIHQYRDTINTIRSSSKQDTTLPISKNLYENYSNFNYEVKEGDNLSRISKIFYGKPENYYKIVSDNNLNFPYTLKIGQKITIKFQSK